MPNLLEALDKTDWLTFRFDEIAHNISKRVEPGATDLGIYVGLEHLDSGSLHIKRTGAPADVDGTKLLVYAGDVIFGRRRAYQRKAAVATFDGICSAHALVLRANQEVIEPRLFPFFMHSDAFMHRAVDISVGGLSPTINWGNLKVEEFLLPPRYQQARLAELLWGADEVEQMYQELIEQQQLVLKSYTTPAFNDSDSVIPLKNCGRFFTGSTPLRAEHVLYFEGGDIPWVKTLDLNNGEIFDTEEKITALALKKTSCKLMPEGTVLVAMYGGFNQIGRTGILRISAATNQAVCSFVPDEKVLLPEFLLYQLNDRREYWKTVAVSSRKDPNITKQDIENFPAGVPSLERQHEIISRIKAITTSIQETRDLMNQAARTKAALIGQIFLPN